jgi:PKD repeat protein/peptidoglycan/xylan/chitin deacetylase (PgdA/CDA1 family)
MTKKLRLGILLTVFLLLAGTASAYPRAVLFTFDDARASVYTTGYPIFKNHGYNATFYVVTNLIGEGNDPGQPTINRYQLEELYYDGWDIGDHTRSHEYFVTDSLDLSEQEAEILDGKEKLDTWGFTRASNHLAFPGGQYDSNTALAMTSVGMLTGRTVESFPLTVPPLNNDVFHLTGVRADLDPAYEDEQYTYLESLSSDNVVIYLTHGVDDPGANATTITSGMLENMLDYMDTHQIPVWTITQLYANISASGSYSPTPHTMTIYPSVDGEVSRQADDSTFSDIIYGEGTNVAYEDTSFFGPVIYAGAGTQSGKFETSTVGVLSFDTSSIPDNATIESASLVLHQAYPSQDNLGPFTLVITNGYIESDTSLTASDYQTRGDWELTERKPFTHITTGNNTFDFKTDGLSWINKKGSTVLFLRRGDDIDGAYAGGPAWAQNAQSEHRWDSMEATDSGERPYLQIDYTIPTPVKPVASFNGTPVSGTVPLTVVFTDHSSGTSITRRWDFGDGNITSYTIVTNPTHVYSSAGTYSVNLTVTNASGSNSLLRPNYITVNERPPVSGFSGTPTTGTIPLTVTFTDGSTGVISGYTWDFGDTATSTEKNPSHQYTKAGTYTVNLTVTGPGGTNTSTNSNYITVWEAPIRTSNVGVFRGLGYWYLDTNNNGTWDGSPPDTEFSWGKQPGDIPITGDWNGDGVTKTGIFRVGGHWYLDTNNNGTWDGSLPDKEFSWGKQPGDIPITGDWNGDNITETGIFRAGGHWYLDMNNNGTWDGSPPDTEFFWGKQPGDIPVTGDWTGDGITKTGIFRPGTGFYLDMNNNGIWYPPSDTMLAWSGLGLQPNDIPVTSDWNGDGITETGIFRNGDWYLDINNNGHWDPGTDVIYPIGQPGDKPVTGKW